MKFIAKILLVFFLSFSHSYAMAQSVGGVTTGATTYCSTTNSGYVTLTAYTGTILNWESSTNGGVNWNTVSNTNPNQTYFNLAQTTCYRAIVKKTTFPPDTSTVVCITIYPPSVGGTISGGGTFCAGSGPGSLTLTGKTGNVLYWQYSTNGGSTWINVTNTTTTLSYTNITQSRLYRAIVQNGSTCPKDTSTQASFIIDPATVAGTVTGTASICSGSNNGTVTLTGYTGSIVRWEKSINSGTTWLPISNTTASQSYLNLTQTTWYRAVVKSGTCTSMTSPHVVITVSSPTVIGTLSGGGNYCGTPATGTLTLSGYTGSVITWLASTNNGGTYTPITNTTATLSYTNLPATTLYKVVVKSGGCPSDTSNTKTVYVAPQTIAGTIASNATVCMGVNLDTILLSGNVGAVLDWIYSTNNGSTWISSGDTSAKKIYSGLTQTTSYKAIVQSGKCKIDTTNEVKITILPPSPVNAGIDVIITQGQSIILNGTGNGTPTWSPAAGLNNTTIFAPAASPVTNTAYILTVIDTNNCMNSDTVIVTVNKLQNIKITNLFTPNGDGINDAWYIQDILNFPDNEVIVYNIYGNEVYNKKGYTNDWKGTYNGSELPDGTYFYVLKLGSSDKIFKGSVDILRNK
jgi:gliding motility-associated-like protein